MQTVQTMISEQRINAQNQINARANEVEGHLIRILSEWQGIKARKISGHGGFVQKLQTQLHEYEQSHGYNVPDGTDCEYGSEWWLTCHASYTTIMATLRNRKTAQKVEMYLARFDDTNGILTHVSECHKRKTDYTVEGVANNIKKANELEEQARQLRSQVRDFSIR